MKSSFFWICKVLLIGTCVFGYDEISQDIAQVENSAHQPFLRLCDASNQFGFNLLLDMVKEDPGNIVFSPLSVSSTLGLIYLGAKGSTEKELEKVLEYNAMNLTKPQVLYSFRILLNYYAVTEEPGYHDLDLVSALFVNSKLGLKSLYKTEARELFRAPVEAVDFDSGSSMEIVAKINDFVRNKTRNNIRSIIDYLDPTMDLIAVNTVYFKSKWGTPFPQERTKNGTFYNAGKFAVEVPMMYREDYFSYYEDSELRVLHMDFWDRNIVMLVLLPHKMDGLPELERNLTPARLSYILDHTTLRPLKFSFPKFNISYSSELVSSLQSMGAREIFEVNSANLTGMLQEDKVSLGGVHHKAVIDITEDGVEASGATAIFSFKSMPLYDMFKDKFNVDHPFLFLIIDERSEIVIFMGRVWNL